MQTKLLLWAISLVMLLASLDSVFADSAVKVPPRFSAAIYNRVSSNLFPAGDMRHEAEVSSFGFLGYKLTDQWTLVALLEISRQLNGAQKVRMANPDIRLFRKGAEFGRTFTMDDGQGSTKEVSAFAIRYGPAVVLPANYDSIYNENFIFGLNAIGRLYFDFTPYGIKGLNGFYDVSLGRQFQKYDTSVDGKSLVPTKIRHLALINYNLSPKWSLFFTGGVSSGWTYNGQVISTYSTSQEIDFAINSTFQIGVGHQLAQGLLNANGSDLDVRAFSEKSSQLYLSINVSL